MMSLQKAIKQDTEDVKHKLSEAYSLMQKAEECSDRADNQEGIRLLLKAGKIYEEILGTEHLETASVYYNLAGLYEAQGKYAEAGKLYTKAVGILEKLLGENHPRVGEIYYNLADLYEKTGEYTVAEKLYRKALPIAENVLGENHDLTRSIRNALIKFTTCP